MAAVQTRSETPYRCFGCPREFASLDDMVAVPGEGDRSPRHFCESCAERLRRGPPMTDGGTDTSGTDRCCSNCGKSVEDESYLYWAFKTCRHCAYEADGRFRDCGSARKWQYFPRWHLTQHPELPRHKRERLATDGGTVESGTDRVVGEPTGVGMGAPPTFDTDKVVDWTCPSCGENGYDNRRTADYYPTCTNTDCRVGMFSVFRSVDPKTDHTEGNQ